MYNMEVITFRIPKEIKSKMKELNINWSKEIREFIIKKIEEAEKEKKFSQAVSIIAKTSSVPVGFSQSSVREDREGR